VERVFGVNTTGVIRGSQLAFARMADRGGAIVNIGSVAVDKVLPKRLTYAASKAAVISMTRYATQDFGPRGVRVNAISPGYIDTRLTTNWAPDDPREIAKHETIARIPARRTGRPADIARAVLFLASDLAAYVHGEVIHVDGGWNLV
jgi:NAD(P)-dependent dehydrogenase (short-subunit alcohol dehydrogenase family)